MKEKVNPEKSIFKERLNILIGGRRSEASVLADYLGCSTTAIGQFRKGITYPSIEKLIKISNYYNVSVDYLLGVSDIKEVYTGVENFCDILGLPEKYLHQILEMKDNGKLNELTDYLDYLDWKDSKY